MNNSTELQFLSMMKFSFQYFAKFPIASPLKCVSDFTPVFFVSKRAFYVYISTKKDTTKDKNSSISTLK